MLHHTWARAVALPAMAFVAATACAQIRTDATLGRPAQSLSGPQYLIPESLGALRGANLFHSFSAFNIASGESATFTTTTLGIANVISRVTGGDPSAINGLLRLAPADGKPNFFFINPAGVTFGAGASVDVPGAFHVSTADYVRFGDGKFYSDPSKGSTLSSAEPEAFGFLGTQRAAVSVNGGARLTAALMQPFSIAAGDIRVDQATVQTRGGDIRIVAVGGAPLEVPMSGALPAAGGRLEILDGGRITAPVEGARNAGNVSVSAGDIDIDGAAGSLTGLFSQANSGTTGNAGTLTVAAAGMLTILGGGVISSSTFASGDAGHIAITAGSMGIAAVGMDVVTGVFSTAGSRSTGNAGSIDVKVRDALVMLDGGTISTGTLSSGRAGEVHVAARDISLVGGGNEPMGIASQAQGGSTGPAGAVTVEASGSLSVQGNGQISASSFGSGPGGAVTVRAGDVTVYDGGRIISSAFDSGAAGTVDVEADRITVDGKFGGSTAIVSNAQSGTGNAGSVRVVAHESLTLLAGGSILSNTFTSGNAGSINVTAGDLTIDNRSSQNGTTTISSNAYGTTGNAGTVTVNVTRSLVLLAGGEISSSSFSAGNARSVTVRAGSIFMDAKDYTQFLTGIFSVAESGSGNAGSVDIATTGDIAMLNGAAAGSSTKTAGAAGPVRISGANLLVDGGGTYAPISSNSNTSATGNAGTVDVTMTGTVTLRDGGSIASSTFSPGNAGTVKVKAGALVIDGGGLDVFTGIASNAYEQSSGNAGTVDVAVTGAVTVRGGSAIGSNAFSRGDAGSVRVVANDITLSNGTISSEASDGTGNAGSVDVSAAGNLRIDTNGVISSSTFTRGNAGAVTVRAGNILIDGAGANRELATGILSSAYANSTGHAGVVDVSATGRLEVFEGGEISSSAWGRGDGGTVRVSAAQMRLDARDNGDAFTGLTTNSVSGATGNGGHIQVDVSGSLEIVGGATITSSTRSAGNAGSVTIHAGSMMIDGHGACPPCTGVHSQSEEGATGSPGEIEITVDGALDIRPNGLINTGTRNTHDAGRIHVTADSILIDGGFSTVDVTGIVSNAIDGTGNGGVVEVAARTVTLRNRSTIGSTTYAAGNGGTVRVAARDIVLDGDGTAIAGNAARSSTGNGGTVDVQASGSLELLNGAHISTTSSGPGNAGAVSVRASAIRIDGGVDAYSETGIVSETDGFGGTNNAGSVDVRATGDVTLARGGLISSDSTTGGSAGSVRVDAANITISDAAFSRTGIFSRAGFFSSAAGTVDVNVAGMLQVSGGGQVSSSSDSYLGPAGSVNVAARDVVVDGVNEFGYESSINARARVPSMGQTGNVTVSATRSVTVSNGGDLSITNEARFADPSVVHPTLLTVSAPTINIIDGGSITAAASGPMPASNIAVHVGNRLLVDNAAITTSAVDGNGGAIVVDGPGALVLRNSRITTSVAGLVGNGGDITIATSGLVMESGFIQANTAADNASGGNVRIDTSYLIPSGNSLFAGGADPLEFHPGIFGYNVIQAAAPTGVSGAITITTPALDISAGLAPLNAQVLEVTALGRGLCDGGSSLAQAGRGGLPPSARGLLRDEDADEAAIAAMPLAALLPVTARLTCAR